MLWWICRPIGADYGNILSIPTLVQLFWDNWNSCFDWFITVAFSCFLHMPWKLLSWCDVRWYVGCVTLGIPSRTSATSTSRLRCHRTRAETSTVRTSRPITRATTTSIPVHITMSVDSVTPASCVTTLLVTRASTMAATLTQDKNGRNAIYVPRWFSEIVVYYCCHLSLQQPGMF